MPKSSSIKYERVSPKEVKIVYQSNGKRTEVVARVVRPGSYDKCDISRSSDSKNGD